MAQVMNELCLESSPRSPIIIPDLTLVCVYLGADLSLSFTKLVVTLTIYAFTPKPLWIIAPGKCININLNEYHSNQCYIILLVTI